MRNSGWNAASGRDELPVEMRPLAGLARISRPFRPQGLARGWKSAAAKHSAGHLTAQKMKSAWTPPLPGSTAKKRAWDKLLTRHFSVLPAAMA